MTKPIRNVRLEPMTEEEYGPWREANVAHYAESQTQAGNWMPGEALAKARESYEGYFPQGLATPGQYVWVVSDAATGERVGTLWVGMRPRGQGHEAYIYGIDIDDAQQGYGFGRATMNACTEKARELGAVSVGLNVFGFNERAYNLYASLGYQTTARSMRLEL